MIVVGLTGSIGSGKSTVSDILYRKNIKIIDADKISKNISKEKEVLEELVKEFGNSIINDGQLDRKKLGNIVFSDAKKLEILNKIMHRKIIDKIIAEIEFYKNNNEKLIVLDAPLLIEANLISYVDVIVLVICSYEVQIDRIMKRDNITKEEVILRISSQMSVEEKKKYATYVIDNSYDLEVLNQQILKILHYLEE